MLNDEHLTGHSSSHYVSREDWDTLEEAKRKAVTCHTADLAHYIWTNQDIERITYIRIIFVILDNRALQLSPEDIKSIKEKVKSAPLSDLREVVSWLGTATALGQLGVKLLEWLLG